MLLPGLLMQVLFAARGVKKHFPPYQGRWTCNECDYNICWRCRPPPYLLAPNCPKCTSELSRTPNMYYICGMCQEEGPTSPPVICPSCGFEVCSTHFNLSLLKSLPLPPRDARASKKYDEECFYCPKKTKYIFFPCGHSFLCQEHYQVYFEGEQRKCPHPECGAIIEFIAPL
eukprot:TRINITY_DN3495_c0_g1_i2.p1 TRINITY_DN3495_c0_g1~~TRINITY_DN3495_c0_g1_i2.p1  ORF type:complete len:172 (+),score=11.85 TRINITY_DN3495_c0_g1_i2:166-681(+)